MLQSSDKAQFKDDPSNDINVYERMESSVRVYCRKFPANFVKAKNAHLWDSTGRRYIDFMSGAGALNYGHNNPFIKDDLIKYLQSDALTHSLDLHTPAKAAFLETLHKAILSPRGLDYKVQFTGPTGSNAVEAALKIARRETGRSSVIAFTNGFHGMTLGALATTANGIKRQAAGTQLNQVTRMPFCDYMGEDVDTLSFLETMLSDPASGIDKPAAIILETVQGEGGINVASTQWLQRLAALANHEKIVLIVDDVQAGCGRTGTFFSFEKAGLSPDIVCLSKSIGGCGQPFAIVLVKPSLDNQLPGEHTGTFRGNNLAFVAAKRALEFWLDGSFLSQVESSCTILNEWMNLTSQRFEKQEFTVRGIGLIQGVLAPSPEIAVAVQRYAFANGVILETCGPTGQVIKIMPPLTIDADDLREGLSIVGDALSHEQNK